MFCAAYICDSVALLYPFSYFISWRCSITAFFFLISTECDSHYIYHILTKMYVPLFKKNYINWRLIALQYCGSFCHTFTWISHGCTCAPHPEPSSRLPPHPIPLGHPSAPALSTLSHALNLDWQSISHMMIYMFQCYSLKSSHPCLLPQSPKICSLHPCLFCCLTYRVIVTIFLNYIYMH